MTNATDTTWSQSQIERAAGQLGSASPEHIVQWALETFGPRTAVACSFSLEDVALIHLAQRTGLPFRVIALDTGRLHEETREVGNHLQARYRVAIEWYAPERTELETLLNSAGPFAFRASLADRKRCCDVRKIRPLRRALAQTPAWLTGLRRAQGTTRTDLPLIALDSPFGDIVKVNPLVDWTDEDLALFARTNALPRNALYDRGFTSIGCAPCTRPTRAGEHPRAGRWWWENPEHAECGLHNAPHRS